MGYEKGIPYLMEAMNKPRDMKQDAGGFWRYTDTRERVFPDAMKPGPQPTDVQRNLVAAGYEPGTDEFLQGVRENMNKNLSRSYDKSETLWRSKGGAVLVRFGGADINKQKQ